MPPTATNEEPDGSPSTTATIFMPSISQDTFNGLNDIQKGFITSIRHVQDVGEEGQALTRSVADMFPPGELFCQEIRSLPSLYSELRNFLDSRGASMTQHSSRRIMMTLAHNLYEEQEDKQAAVDIVHHIIASGRRSRDVNTASQTSQPVPVPTSAAHVATGSSSDKVAHNMAMRLKDAARKFSGAIGECWMEYVDDYKQIARDYNLSVTQKLQYMHNLLRGDAKRFYLDKVDNYATSFNQAVDIIEREYNSTVRQTKVKNYLNTLRISNFVNEGIEMSDALAKLHNVINKLARQAPASHRGEAHKIEFLHQAVVGFEWSKDPLTRIATNNLSFEELYGELENALQLEKEAEIAQRRDKISTRRRSNDEDIQGILYTGQGRYARPPSTVNNRGRHTVNLRKSSHVPKTFDPLSVAGCFNCDDRGHVLSKCPKPLNVKKAAANRLDYYAKKRGTNPYNAHLVLAEICYQIDLGSQANSSNENETQDVDIRSDKDIFKTLFAHVEVDINHSTIGIIAQEDAESSDDEASCAGEEMFTVFEDESEEVVIGMSSEKIPIEFLGACIDTGAQRSVIGKRQAVAYCDFMRLPFKLDAETHPRVFKFGERRYKGLGTLKLRIPTDNYHFILAKVEVVDIDVPLLLGLEFLAQYGISVDVARYMLLSEKCGWELPLARKSGHLYLEWPAELLYTTTELRKMHQHFFHPKSERLYAVLRRADPTNCTPQDMHKLEEISRSCDVCQRLSRAPSRFRVSLPKDDIVFNRILCVDIMFLKGKAVFHCVDRETKFNAASFLPDQTVDTAWKAYQTMWSLPYVGHPEHMHADQGPQFKSRRWEGLCHLAGIDLTLSGVEGHNALGEGERYHSYLRLIFNKVQTDFPHLDEDYTLQLAIKAVNDTAGPNGLVPTLLVFGILPRALVVPIDLPQQKERMKAMRSACDEMAKAISRRRLSTALKSNAPAATSSDVSIGSEVLVHRESPVGKWEGPYPVRDLLGKHVFVDIDGRLVKFSVDKVKRYIKDGVKRAEDRAVAGVDIKETNEGHSKALDELITALRKDVGSLKSVVDEPINSWEFFTPEVAVHQTKILTPNDPDGDSETFRPAKFAEVEGLVSKNTWTVVNRKDLPKDANILGGRFVLTLKEFGSHNETPKARYVAQGHLDKDKEFLVHNTTNLRQRSIRVIMSFAAVKGYRVFSHDVKQAYLQSDEDLTRKIYITPKRKDLEFFKVSADEVLDLQRPLYGNGDSGDYWGATVDRHVKEDLKMTPTCGDPSLYITILPDNSEHGPRTDEAEGSMGVYVDDMLLAGNVKFQNLTELTLQKFESRERAWDNFVFFGCTIKTVESGFFEVDQQDYIRNIGFVPTDATFDQYRSLRAETAWATHTRPDVSCCVNRGAQVVPEPSVTVREVHVKLLNSAIKRLKSTPGLGLKYGRLDENSLHLRVYTDASFGTNDDLTSQLGLMVLLCDKENNCHILDFASKKCKRVVRSILGGEVYAFTEGFDSAYMIRHDLQRMYGRSIPLQMRTDSKQMFDVVTKASSTSERRLMIDIAAAREAYNANEISNVCLVRSEHNPADGLTKVKFCKALDEVLRTGMDKNPVQQWIIRTTPRSSS